MYVFSAMVMHLDGGIKNVNESDSAFIIETSSMNMFSAISTSINAFFQCFQDSIVFLKTFKI